MLYGMKTVAMTEKQVGRMEGAESKTLRWALGVTRENKLRGTRLLWYEHVKRREEGYVGKRIMEMAIPGKRKRGRPNKDGSIW